VTSPGRCVGLLLPPALGSPDWSGEGKHRKPNQSVENMSKSPTVCEHRRVACEKRFGGLSCAVFAAAAALILAPRSSAQFGATSSSSGTSGSVISALGNRNQYSWTESFDGSANSDGQVMALDSSVGYSFGSHTLVSTGLPVYFVHATIVSATGTSTTNSFTAFGDFHGLVRLSFPGPVINFKTQLTGTAPTGSTSDGISTGHATFDWTNRWDRGMNQWTPFFEIGLANSLPDTFIYRRPFASFGMLSHFQAGTEFQVLDWLGVAVSGFDVAPWGSQTIDSRVAGKGAASSGGHGPAFNNGQKITGGSSLTADNGFAAEVDLSPGKTADFTLGYSRSTHYSLNIFSFGLTVNMRELLQRSSL